MMIPWFVLVCLLQTLHVETFSTTIPTSAQLKEQSLNKFLQLPDKWIVSKETKSKYQQNINTLCIDHPLRLGVTRKQRTTQLLHAAEVGNTTRIEVLLLAGVDVDAVDIYRVSSLMYTRMHDHVKAERLLLDWGASDLQPFPTIHLNDTALQLQYKYEQDTNNIPTITTIEIGKDSFYIDNALCDEFIDDLVKIHNSLSKEEGKHHQQHQHRPQSTNAARRCHYCDTEGWVCQFITNALKRYNLLHQQQESLQHVFPHFRFISYIGEDATTSFLKPHIDFSVLDRSSGNQSKYTFILYLTTVENGGETVLLDHLPSMKKDSSELNHEDLSIRCAVQPVKGRLLVFPHLIPHAGLPVVKGDKLILRGDVC